MPWSNTVSTFQNLVESRTCFVVGATGEVGKALVHELLTSNAFQRIIIIARRTIEYCGPNKDILEEKLVDDFDKIETEEYKGLLDGCQFGFCALGTTRAKAGSPEGFRKVDHDYVLAVGRMAKAGGCRWFGLVSAASADAKSSFLYSRTKGETETDLTALEFPHLFIYRPGLLQCNRAESRPLERMAGWLAPIMNFCSGGRAAIPVETVAKVMVQDTMDTAITEARKEHTVELKTISNKAMIDSARLLGVS